MIIFDEELDLYKLHVMLRHFELTDFDVYCKSFDGVTEYLFITQVSGYDLDQADIFKLEIWGGGGPWRITVPYQGETKVTFHDQFGSYEISVSESYRDPMIRRHNSLNPVYYEIVQCLIRMGVRELSYYCVEKKEDAPFYLFGPA